MNIGFAGPVSLRMLQPYVASGTSLPKGYECPLMASWVKELLRRGHHVWLYTLAPEIHSPATFTGDSLTIRVGRYRHRAKDRALDLFAKERADLRIMMREDPCDLIHANWTYEFALAALASGKPTLVTAHDAPFRVLRYSRDAYRLLRTVMALRVARAAPNMTAVSADIAEHFRRFLRHREPIEVIPNFLSSEVFAIGVSGSENGRSEPVFASVLTGWGKMKNGKAALRAFGAAHGECSKFLMFGTGFEENGPAHLWASRHGLERGVEFIGSVPHDELLRRLADDVDVLVHPSLVEALSVSVMEGMALGLPIIAGAQTGGMKYLLEDGKAGILVNVGSVSELANAMIALGADSSLRQRLGTVARNSALRRLHADVVIPLYEKMYARILAESRN